MRSTKSGSAKSDSIANSQPVEGPRESFGISAFTSCLVDAGGNTNAGAGRARRKALGVSALAQFCTIAAILIVSLFATGTRLILRPTNFVPLPPYGGAPKHGPSHPQPMQIRTTSFPGSTIYPIQIQRPTQPTTENDATDEGTLQVGTADSSHNRFVAGGGDGTGGRPNILIGDGPGPQPPRPDPTPAPPVRRPLAVSQGVELALLTHRVEPIYPNFAKQTHREGTVELRAIISTEGVVKDLQVLSGDPVLAQAARDAVSQWRFRPTLLNGIAVEVITFITVNFHIGQ